MFQHKKKTYCLTFFFKKNLFRQNIATNAIIATRFFYFYIITSQNIHTFGLGYYKSRMGNNTNKCLRYE